MTIALHKTSAKDGSKFEAFLIYVYFAITFFEPYLSGVIGNVTKYYVFLVMLVVILQNGFKIRIHSYIMPFVVWLLYRFISLLWTDNLTVFRNHVLSQIGMVGLLLAINMQPYSKKTVFNIAKVMWASSFIISLLAIFFGQAYHGTVAVRQVLVLFGQEVDPNDQAAFALVGICVALYYLLYEKKCIILTVTTLAVNVMSMFMTGSRGGLVSTLAVVLFTVFFNARKKSIAELVRKSLIFAIIAVLAYYVLENYIPQEIADRLFNADGYSGGGGRTDIWGNGLDLLLEDLNLFFGAGWGDYYGYNGIHHAMHNTYLAMLCDVGLIGFSLFFFPIVLKAIECIKRKECLPVMLLIAGFAPSFFLDAINKRFLWNAIMFLFMYYMSNRE